MFKQDVAQHASDLLDGLVPGIAQKHVVPISAFQGKQEIISWMQPAVFAIRKDLQTVAGERENLPTIRFAVHGTRAAVIARTTAVARFMEHDGTKPQKQSQLWSWLRSATSDQLRRFLSAGHQLFHGTLGPGDGLFLPPGVIIAERVLAMDDVVGIRKSWVYHDCLVELDEVSGVFGADQKPWPIMDEALALARAHFAAAPLPGVGDGGGGGDPEQKVGKVEALQGGDDGGAQGAAANGNGIAASSASSGKGVNGAASVGGGKGANGTGGKGASSSGRKGSDKVRGVANTKKQKQR